MWKSLMARGNPRIPRSRPVRGPLTRSASAGRVQIRMRQPRHGRSVHAAPAQCIAREYVSLRCCGTTGCRGRETPRRRGNRSGPHLPDGFAEWRTPQITPGARSWGAGRPGGLLQRRSCVLRDCRKPGFALESRNSAFGWSAEIGAPASQVCQCGAAKTAECFATPNSTPATRSRESSAPGECSFAAPAKRTLIINGVKQLSGRRVHRRPARMKTGPVLRVFPEFWRGRHPFNTSVVHQVWPD